MSNDWIKFRLHARHQKILDLSIITGDDPLLVLGAAVEWFHWIDQQCDGPETRLTPALLNAIVGRPYAEAFEQIGWVKTGDDGRIIVVDYDSHFSQSAKRRAEDARRKSRARRKKREASAECPEPCGQNADQEQEREGEGEEECLGAQRTHRTPKENLNTEGAGVREPDSSGGDRACTAAESNSERSRTEEGRYRLEVVRRVHEAGVSAAQAGGVVEAVMTAPDPPREIADLAKRSRGKANPPGWIVSVAHERAAERAEAADLAGQRAPPAGSVRARGRATHHRMRATA
jgi:hypothetical protein